MAQFTMPLNWQPDYFDRICFDKVGEVYGKLREDFPGGGKSSMAQADPSRKTVSLAVKEAHKRGIAFNYLINTTCIGNRELTRNGYRAMHKLLDWLSNITVDRVTLALPFLVEMVKKHYPHFKVSISTQAGVDSLEKVQYWHELGADSITLSHVLINRNFDEISRICKNSSCEVQLIVNMICKRRCPFVTLHGNFNAHASQAGQITNRYNMDYYFIACLARNFSDPLSIIKSNWIRPEDIALYENLGIKRFKIAERGLTTEALARIITAYSDGSYHGNFMDLVPTMSKYLFIKDTHFKKAIKELFRIGFVNIFKLHGAIKKIKDLKQSESYYHDLGIHIDNKSLDGVLDNFMKMNCFSKACVGCTFCETIANRHVRISGDPEQHARDISSLNAILDGMVSGSYF